MTPLKELYTADLVRNLGRGLKKRYGSLSVRSFEKAIFDENWPSRTLLSRMEHITRCMHDFLPSDYLETLDILLPVAAVFRGFESMFFPQYVEFYGLDDFHPSVQALEVLTEYSSSEFAVRPFILRYPKRMMKVMERWADSPNEHVRRLASEGSRPRLPWSFVLQDFKKDPTPTLSILEKLCDDPSAYVRKSVANHLNDISKDHPEILLALGEKWRGKSVRTDWVLKHACRTLLKAGEPRALHLFGFEEPSGIFLKEFCLPKQIPFGGDLDFSFLLQSKKPLGKIRVDFALDLQRSGNKRGRKVFKISEQDSAKKNCRFAKIYSFRKISTRRYYPGLHAIEVLVNGKFFARKEFTLLPDISP